MNKHEELSFPQELSAISLFHLYNLSRSGIGHIVNWIRSLDVDGFDKFLEYVNTHDIREEAAFADYCKHIDRVREEQEKIKEEIGF